MYAFWCVFAGAWEYAAGETDGMRGVRRGRKERASPLLESGDSGTESEQRFNTPAPASGYGEFNRSAHSTRPGLESRCLKEEVQFPGLKMTQNGPKMVPRTGKI